MEETGGLADDGIFVGADEFGGSVLEGFRSFGGVAHDEHGLAQAGGLFLYAAGVGEEEVATVHGPDKSRIFEGLDEMDVGVALEKAADGFGDVWVEMDGIDELAVGVSLGKAEDGGADGLDALSEVFRGGVR